MCIRDRDGSYAASSDGKVAYLTYKFSEKNPPEYFGAQVLPTDSNALLQYVLNEKGKLYEVRLQYGKLSKDSYDAIVSNISGTYGNYTFARTYSNGSAEHWWKTKSITLIAYYQSTSVSVYPVSYTHLGHIKIFIWIQNFKQPLSLCKA